MNTRKILTMSLLAALCGCQPETPAQGADPAAAAPSVAQPPQKQAPEPAAKTAPRQPESRPAGGSAQAAGDRRIVAAEQTAIAPPSAPAKEKPAQASPGPAADASQAAESGTLLKSDDLKAEPFRDAKTVATLATGDKVDILKKDGGWYQVKSAKGRGWVRMLSIRKGDVRKGGSDAAGLLGLASGRAGTGKVVATTGIRGLNEEELKAAKFNEEELKRAESYATGKSDAAKFAAQGDLVARPFNYLPAPK